MTQRTPDDLVHLFANCASFDEAFAVFKEKTPPRSNSIMLEAMALHFERTSSKVQLMMAYRRIGDIYLQMSEFDEAIRWYNKARRLEEKD